MTARAGVRAAILLVAGASLAAVGSGCADPKTVRPAKPAVVQIGPDPEFADVAVPTPFSHADLQRVLDLFVDEDGRVEYVSLKWADEPLRRYLAMAAKVAPKDGVDDAHFPDANHRLAYWINVYNAAVLAAVCRAYPIERIDQVDGFFTRMTFSIGGRRMSLDEIEAAMRRQSPYSWRAGFALCRATTGSAKLREKIYHPSLLDHQLDEQFAEFLKTDQAVEPDAEARQMKLSPVFRKYAKPMVAEARHALGIEEPTIRDVLRRHADAKLSHRIAVAEGYAVRYAAESELNDRQYNEVIWSRRDGP